MIKSMTGFGKTTAEIAGRKITIEIRSLNSKSLDLNTRLPWMYREKESEIRKIISQKLERGKIDMTISFDVLDIENVPVINKAVVINYYEQMKEIAGELNIKTDEQILATIMRLPDAFKTEKPELAEEEWQLVKENIVESAGQLDNYRIEEGSSIEIDLKGCINRILTLLTDIKNFEEERTTGLRNRLKSILAENIGTENIDMNKFEQELIYYLEKMDINEEKVRLKKHCEYFLEKTATEPPNGKILGFIAQEIGREINTIGSKANDASIQKLVVMMKDELEKIKEQTMNVL